MSLNDTPGAERLRIGFFGVRNAGKSSPVNAFTGQSLSVTSPVAGTTTDAVVKGMELLPVGPVTVVDTPGIDDEGDLGCKRADRARDELRRCDVAVLVVDATRGVSDQDRELLSAFAEKAMPCVVAFNKVDLLAAGRDACGEGGVAFEETALELPEGVVVRKIAVSAATGMNIRELRESVAVAAGHAKPARRVIADLVNPGGVVVLVIPIDSSAPKGRIILPQQMVLRDLLDAHAAALACQPEELAGFLGLLARPPKLVVTDSQVFSQVAAIVPPEVPLTSFSILMARRKGQLSLLIEGANALGSLIGESRVLVCEGCTHHRQCEDIGTVKMPAWIKAFCGAEPRFEFVSGKEFPDSLEGYDLVVHCGGCMLNGREMGYRLDKARAYGVPIVNYGIAIAHMNGILERSLDPLRGKYS